MLRIKLNREVAKRKTHWIYEIPGRKVGCTENLEQRKAWYGKERHSLVVLEILYNSTEQEAGDKEWEWADKLGYKRGFPHFAKKHRNSREHFVKMARMTVERGKTGFQIMTSEQHREACRKGAASTHAQGKGGFANLPKEQRIANGKKSAAKNNPINAAAGKLGAQQRTRCPHCGLESTVIILKRWHFDYCPHIGLRATKETT
jgi:hypothetical protein